jgi:hypothetical protein
MKNRRQAGGRRRSGAPQDFARELDDFFFGTLAPFFRASDSPIAMACLRLFTRPP